jgi:hypothetical protein
MSTRVGLAFGLAVFAVSGLAVAASRENRTTTTVTTTTKTTTKTTSKTVTTTNKPPAWAHCPAGRPFRCETRSQAVAPAHGEQIPGVCGCVPRCPPSQPVLIAHDAGGRWPDGSLKGAFSCSTSTARSSRSSHRWPAR